MPTALRPGEQSPCGRASALALRPRSWWSLVGGRSLVVVVVGLVVVCVCRTLGFLPAGVSSPEMTRHFAASASSGNLTWRVEFPGVSEHGLLEHGLLEHRSATVAYRQELPIADRQRQVVVPITDTPATLLITAHAPPHVWTSIKATLSADAPSAFPSTASPRASRLEPEMLPIHRSGAVHFALKPAMSRMPVASSAVELSVIDNVADSVPLLAPLETPRLSRLISLPGGTAGAGWEPVVCRTVWDGRRCRLWASQMEPWSVQQQRWAQALGQLIEQHLLPRIEADQGAWPDVDGDGCVNVVLTARVASIQPDLLAFVRRDDFLPVRTGTGMTRDAGWDAVYVQTDAELSRLVPILLHELTHVAQFSWSRELCGDRPWPMPDWLTEGLAHAAELRCQGGIQNVAPRIAAYLAQPELAPLTVTDAAASDLWRDPAQRGASALFCWWWTQRHPAWNWPELIQAFDTADDPWQQLSGLRFSDLYREFAIWLTALEWSDGHEDALQPESISDAPIPGAAIQTVRTRELSSSGTTQLQLRGTATTFLTIPADIRQPHYLVLEGPALGNWSVTLLRDASPSSSPQQTPPQVPRVAETERSTVPSR